MRTEKEQKTKNKTYNKWLNCTKRGHVWTENEIIFFRKYLNGSSSIDINTVYYLASQIDNKNFKITDQQSVKGILWLKNKCFTNNFKIRKNCPFKNFEINVIKNFKEFRFVGLYNVSENFYRNYMPIYRCIAHNGDYFEYVAYTWGKVKVLSIKSKNFETWSNQPDFDKTRNNLRVA